MPSFRIVDFTEYDCLLRCGSVLVSQLIRSIRSHPYRVGRGHVVHCQPAKRVNPFACPGEVVPDDCSVMQVYSADKPDFLVRCSCRNGRADKPAVAHRIAVDNRRIIASYDNVLSVQGRCQRQGRKAVFDFLYGGGRIDRSYYPVDFRVEVLFYQVLVSLELRRAVSSYAFVMIARMRIVESIDTYVQHPVIRGGVLQDDFIHRSGIELAGEIALAHEVVVVQISFARRKQVKGDQENDSEADQRRPFEPGPVLGLLRIFRQFHHYPADQGAGGGYENEAAHGVFAQHCPPVIRQGPGKDIRLSCIGSSGE